MDIGFSVAFLSSDEAEYITGQFWVRETPLFEQYIYMYILDLVRLPRQARDKHIGKR
jgi:hypothetical protein